MRKVLIVLFFFCFSPVSAQELTREQSLDVIFSNTEVYNSIEIRKLVYKAIQLSDVAHRYSEDPALAPVYATSAKGGYSYSRIAKTSKEPLDIKMRELDLEIDGTDLSTNPNYKLFHKMASMFPGPGKPISSSLQVFGLMVDEMNPGSVPDFDETNIKGFGSFLEELKAIDPYAYELIKNEIQTSLGLDIESENINHHTAVIDFQNRVQSKSIEENVTEVISLVKRQAEQTRKKELEAAKAKATQEEYKNFQKSRSDVRAGFSSASMLASILGEPEAANKIDTFGKIVDQAMLLDASVNTANSMLKMGTMASIQSYVAIANLAVSLFSGAGAGDPVMAQLRVIIEMLQQISAKLDKEFYIVNEKLDALDEKLDVVLEEARATNRVQVKALEDLKNQVTQVESFLKADPFRLQSSKAAEMFDNCLVGPTNYVDLDFETERDFRTTCVTPIVIASSSGITMEYLSGYPTGLEDINDFAFGRARGDAFPLLVNLLGDPEIGNHQGYNDVTFNKLVNPELWVVHSTLFSYLVKTHPHLQHEIGEEKFDQIIDAGQHYRKAYQNLVTESADQLRMSLFDRLLQAYRNQTLELLRLVKQSAEPLSGTNTVSKTGIISSYGFNTTLDLDNNTAPDFSWIKTKSDSLSWCPDEEDNISIEQFRAGFFKGSEIFPTMSKQRALNWLKSHKRYSSFARSMKLPEYFEKALPNQLRWLLKLDHQSLNVCLSSINLRRVIGRYSGKGVSRTAGGLNVDYAGQLVFKFLFRGQLVSVFSFKVDGNYHVRSDTKWITNNPAFAALHGLGFEHIGSGGHTGKNTIVASLKDLTTVKVAVEKGMNKDLVMTILEEGWLNKWDLLAIENFSERNVDFMNLAKQNYSMAALLFFALDLGVNNELSQKAVLKNQLLRKGGLASATSYVHEMILQNKTIDELTLDLDASLARFKQELEKLVVEAKAMKVPLYQEPLAVSAQLERLLQVRQHGFQPLTEQEVLERRSTRWRNWLPWNWGKD